ncbi:MAG: DUF2975 domain-containing protein [Bacteroidetes bacterium]|nr:DUF2975 domain-containing protein [Bacteroidota bacterium]
MEKLKKPLSIKVIYWITVVTFWIYVAGTIFVLFVVGALLFFDLNDLQLHVGIPVSINVIEKGTLDLNILSNITSVELTGMTGKVHFIDTPPEVGRVYALFIFSIMLLFLYIFLTFKRFITNVYNGMHFDMKNISLLKRISYTLVVIWVFSVFYAYFQYYFLVINMNFNTVEFTSDVQTSPENLLVALFIWVLSHIFMKGCELQEENQLTV